MNTHPELAGRLNWLLNHSLQAGVLVVLVLVVQWIFRGRLTNRWRFALWWIVLVRLLLPFSPQSAMSLFNLVRPAVQIESPRPGTPMDNVPVSAPVISMPATDAQPPPMEHSSKVVSAAPASPPPAQSISVVAPVAEAVSLPKQPVNWRALLVPGVVGLWMAGVLILSGVVLWQVSRFYRKLFRATPPANVNLQPLLDECRHEFGVSQRVEIMETDAVQSPALFGLLRLRLLVPHGFGGQFSGRELRYIFLHELAHVKRGDLWLNWLVTALQILHWFNPLLWLGFARLRADRELACDELALLRAGDSAGTAYGETVMKLLENLSCPASIPGLVGILEDKQQMRRRISMIANFRRPGRWSALAVLLIAVVGAAALTDAQTEKPATGSPQPAIEQRHAVPASANSARPDLIGTVSVKGGGALPVAASVFIETAGPKTGTSTFCPSCYADCVKHSQADAQGNFKIESLDPQLTFQILAVAKGYQPKSVSKVDPAKGPVKIELQPLIDADATPEHSVRGRVVDAKDKPVEGAVVETEGYETKDGGGMWGSLPGFDPLAVSDENGEFLITSKKSFDTMDVKVSARTFADKRFNKLPAGKVNELVIAEGATITGRVLSGGRPLAGVKVGVSGVERQIEDYVGHFEIGTDADGKFAFINIPPDANFWIYTDMGSMKKSGAVPIQKIRSGKDGETMDAGDLIAMPAHRLAGRVVLADGAPLPPKVRLLVSREESWDSMQVTLDADGNFDTTGVPDELMSLSARVKGYHVSARNVSVDQMNPFQLVGRVDRDITNLVFMLEKGPDPQPDYSHVDPEYNENRNRTLRGAEGAVDHSHEWVVSGHVLDADTKLPVPSFCVTPGQPDNFQGTVWNTLRAVDGSNGTYTVYISKRSAQPTLKVEADGYMPASLDVEPGGTADVDFVLQKGRDPQGTVVTPEGKPASGATLVLFSGGINEVGFDPSGELRAQGNRTKMRTADADGKFSFKPVLGTKFLLASSSNGFAAIDLETLATNPTVTLEPYGKITGILKRTSGPGTNEMLDIRCAGDLANINMNLHARTDEQGQFTFGGVPSGHLRISDRQSMGGRGWHENPLREVDLKPGQSLQVSIEAGDRPPPETNSYQPPPPPKAVPGQQIKGVVLLPDGRPAADAEVALQISDTPYLFQIGHGRFSNEYGARENGTLVNAGPDGAFTLPLYEKASSVVAISEDGYAQVSLDDLKTSPQIYLQKWGRIEGTLRVSHHLGTNETMDLSTISLPRTKPGIPASGQNPESTNATPEALIPPMYDSNGFRTRTDGQGKFIITFVPPGKRSVFRRISIGPGAWTQSPLGTVDVKAGETVVTNLGGGGRTVAGKIEYQGDPKVDFTQGMGDLIDPTVFKLVQQGQELKTDAERRALFASSKIAAVMAKRRSFPVPVGADGTFRAEDVPPGDYKLSFQPSIRFDSNSHNWTIFITEADLSVPEAKNADDDSTVELGTLELKQQALPILGDAAKTK